MFLLLTSKAEQSITSFTDRWGSKYQLGIMFSFILINYVADAWVEVWHKAALDGFLQSKLAWITLSRCSSFKERCSPQCEYCRLSEVILCSSDVREWALSQWEHQGVFLMLAGEESALLRTCLLWCGCSVCASCDVDIRAEMFPSALVLCSSPVAVHSPILYRWSSLCHPTPIRREGMTGSSSLLIKLLGNPSAVPSLLHYSVAPNTGCLTLCC